MTTSLPQFVANWQASTRSERSAAQEHFLGLCDVLGHPHPAQLDPSGAFFTFERGASKSGGGEGWADVWYREHFAWEYKGKHKDLAAAYQQLLKYRESLENPRLLVVCDLERFEVHTNFTNTAKEVYRFSLADLLLSAPLEGKRFSALEVLRALFYDPESLKPQQSSEQVTEDAAREFAKLAESLRRRGNDPERAAHFLIRLLFCLFAEDTGLLPDRLFSELVRETRNSPEEFDVSLRELFGKMAGGGRFGVKKIRHFNGGLFADDATLALEADDLAVLGRAARLDWASVKPSIFGTLFERSLDPSKRSQLGAHYTSEDDILLIVEPVLMAPLRRRWAEVRREVEALRAARDKEPGGSIKWRNRQGELANLLGRFSDELAAVRVLDPACGSGNFLYIALKRLLDLWKEVWVYSSALGIALLPRIGPQQLYGLETNVYAHELASVVVWIGYLQWWRENDALRDEDPVLKPLHNIQRMDAIMAYDDAGRPVEPAWPQADVIIGNPPFLGDKKMRGELGDKYVEDLRKLYEGRVPGGADLVTYWFERAREQVGQHITQRVGLLATQSIRAGANRRVLEHIKETGDIFFAQSDRSWVLDGADVRVSMVGFDSGVEQERLLDNQPVQFINPNLTATIDLTLAMSLDENANISFIGTQKGGDFDLDASTAHQMLSKSYNPNGRPNSDVIRPWVNGIDITNRPRGMWIIDFGADMSEDDAALYEAPFEYIKQHVKPERDKTAGRDSGSAHWWLHQRPRPAMRAAFAPLQGYIATPRVARHRVFVLLDKKTLPDSRLNVFARDDYYFFGVLHSKPHELWSLRLASRHGVGNDPTYNAISCFETFPFPWPPGKEPQGDARVAAIAQAARELVEKRDRWLNPPDADEAELKRRTLTNLYNARPQWLALAHEKLDRAVLDAYGWPQGISDEEILARLLALNGERAGGGA